MPAKRYLVTLTPEERDRLTRLTHSGKGSARTLTRARILLKADQADDGPAWEDAQIAVALDVGHRTVERVRQRFVERGVDAALAHAPQARRRRGGPADCRSLLRPAGRAGGLDTAAPGRPAGGVAGDGHHRPGDGPPGT
jgi:hypothetical protein